jgi:hypothetical protein
MENLVKVPNYHKLSKENYERHLARMSAALARLCGSYDSTEQSMKPCERCGNPVKGDARRFCSRECQVLVVLFKGDDALEKAARQRSKKVIPILEDCEICGGTATDRHHKDGNVWNNDRSNLQQLCRKCHMTIDGRLALLPYIPLKKDPRPCAVCSRPSNPHRRGMCQACYKRKCYIPASRRLSPNVAYSISRADIDDEAYKTHLEMVENDPEAGLK